MSTSERTYRTPALILKRRDFGEADRLLTILSPTHGKCDAIAKGARKPVSTKTGHVELFTCADMLITRGRDIDIATQAEMTNPFLHLREDLRAGAYANYIAELVDKFTFDGDQHLQTLYDLTYATFQRLCDDKDLRLAVRFFEIHLLDVVGFRPELTQCVITHEKILPEDQFFSFADGGVVSPRAHHLTTGTIPVSMDALHLMRHIQRSDYEQVRGLGGIKASVHPEVERIMLGYIGFLLERRLESIEFIRRVRDI
ncbi:MAG: DNA repair protein RecO [Anaerolineae bacterium]|jgi:DNA repair protein RecO (recombination protein O)|nr:DNA repair protein RecO [Anaerolineae bacterium]